MKRFCLMLTALAALLLLPATHAVAAPAHAYTAAQNHVVKVEDADWDPMKWHWIPEIVDVKVGDTVTWDMTGAHTDHTATADDGSWDSGYIVPGGKWTHRFSTVGDIHYHCTPHHWKKGVIRVHP
jgi:plastocyanin